jgi:hypothetical protein
LINGVPPVRDTGDEPPANPRRSAVPPAGKSTWTPDSDPGLAPAPQG